MPTAKINTVVDAAAFTAFYDTFQQYSKAFEGQPEAWQEVGKASGESRKSFEEAAKSMRDLSENMNRALGASRGLDKTTRETASNWARIASASKTASGHIKEATESLLKWAGIGGFITGIVGAGSVYGLDRFAVGVGRNRSFAMGVGTTYGSLQSYKTSFQRFGDPEGMLGRVNEAQSDVSKSQAFAAVGMTRAETQGDSADVAALYQRRLKEILDKVDPSNLGVELQNRHALVSLSQARLLKETSWEEFNKADKDRRAGRDAMSLTPQQQRAWQDFATQLSSAGVRIETIFVKNLANLEPGLEHLSDAVVTTVATLFKENGPVAHWLSEANTGLEWLATNMGTPAFKEGVQDFVEEVGRVAKSIGGIARSALEFVHWLAGLTGDTLDQGAVPAIDGAASGTGAQPGGATPSGRSPLALRNGGRGGGGTGASPGGGSPRTKGAWWTDERIRHAYDVLTKGGLSPLEAEGQIARMAYVEAGAGPTAANGSGHFGIYQADRNRQRSFGGSTDFDAQLQGIIKEKNSSEARSHKIGMAAKTNYDGARAASAFERGEGSRSDGTDNFTGTTERYMPKIHAIVAPKVTISKNTGGNPTTGVTAAATPP